MTESCVICIHQKPEAQLVRTKAQVVGTEAQLARSEAQLARCEPSQPGLRSSRPGLRPSQPGLEIGKTVPFLGSGPDRGRSPVEWGDFPSVCPSVLAPLWLARPQAWLAV